MYAVSDRFLAALHESHTAVCVVDLMRRGEVVASDLPVLAGEVVDDSLAVVRRSATVTLAPRADLLDLLAVPPPTSTGLWPLGNELRIRAGIRFSHGAPAIPAWNETIPRSTLLLPGTSNALASTPDSAGLRITGGIDVRIHVRSGDWSPAAVSWLVSKVDTTAGYGLNVRTAGTLRFTWGDGAGQVLADSTVAVPFADGARGWVRATLDVVDGTSKTVRFYTSTDTTEDRTAVTWTPLGAAVTSAGTTAIGTSATGLFVGSAAAGPLD